MTEEPDMPDRKDDVPPEQQERDLQEFFAAIGAVVGQTAGAPPTTDMPNRRPTETARPAIRARLEKVREVPGRGLRPASVARWLARAAAAAAIVLLFLLPGVLVWIGGRDPGPLGQEIRELKEELAKARLGVEQLREGLYASGPVALDDRRVLSRVSTALRHTGHDQIRVDPRELDGLLCLIRGTTLVSARRYSSAARSFHGASDSFLNVRYRILSMFALGTTQKLLNQHDRAVETYDRILKINAAGPKVRALEAMAEHFKGYSTYCLARDMKDPHQAQSKLRTAEDSYKRALDLEPAYHKVRYNLVILYRAMADLAEAEGKIKPASDLRNRATQEMEKARAGLRQRLQADPGNARGHFTLAMVYVLQKNNDLARRHLKKAVDLDPSLAVLVRTEHVFDALRSTEEYKDIEAKADRLGHEASPQIFFDADLPFNGRPEGGRPDRQQPSPPGTGKRGT